MTQRDKERIEKDAKEYCHGSPQYIFEWRGYIAGATADNERMADKLTALEMADNIMLKDLHEQLKQERDKAIDECIATLKRESELYNAKIIVNALYEVSLILEALKS